MSFEWWWWATTGGRANLQKLKIETFLDESGFSTVFGKIALSEFVKILLEYIV